MEIIHNLGLLRSPHFRPGEHTFAGFWSLSAMLEKTMSKSNSSNCSIFICC